MEFKIFVSVNFQWLSLRFHKIDFNVITLHIMINNQVGFVHRTGFLFIMGNFHCVTLQLVCFEDLM